MKAALCLSGHLRTFRDTAKSLKQHIIDPLNCDVFIHTWDALGAPTGKNPGDIDYQSIITNSLLPQIYQLLAPKAIVIDHEQSKTQELIERTKDIQVPSDEQQYVIKHIGLHLAMFYSIWAANELKKQYETYTKYDVVIRCRPDLHFTSPLPLNFDFMSNKTVYVPEIATYSDNGINDQLAMGNSEIMDQYCNAYSQIENYYRFLLCEARPEVMLKFWLDSQQIPIQQINSINYDIYRLDGSILRQHKMHAEWAPGNFLKN